MSAKPVVSLSEAQAFVRVDTGEEEAVLAGLIRTASALCESFLGSIVITRDVVIDMRSTGSWQRLPVAPVTTIIAVEGVDSSGMVTSLPVEAYDVDVDADGEGWLRLTSTPDASRIRVSANVGMATNQNDVPEPIRQGVIRLVAHLYAQRDGSGGEAPAAVTALWSPYRRRRLA